MRFFTTYLEQPYVTPRQTDREALFESSLPEVSLSERLAQAVSIPHSPCVSRLRCAFGAPLAYQPLKRNWIAHLSTAESEASRREVFTQPQRQAYCAQHFWLEPPRMSSGNFDVSCVQTDLCWKALFTTLNITCSFESRHCWLDGILILPFLLGITTNIAN